MSKEKGDIAIGVCLIIYALSLIIAMIRMRGI